MIKSMTLFTVFISFSLLGMGPSRYQGEEQSIEDCYSQSNQNHSQKPVEKRKQQFLEEVVPLIVEMHTNIQESEFITAFSDCYLANEENSFEPCTKLGRLLRGKDPVDHGMLKQVRSSIRKFVKSYGKDEFAAVVHNNTDLQEFFKTVGTIETHFYFCEQSKKKREEMSMYLPKNARLASRRDISIDDNGSDTREPAEVAIIWAKEYGNKSKENPYASYQA